MAMWSPNPKAKQEGAKGRRDKGLWQETNRKSMEATHENEGLYQLMGGKSFARAQHVVAPELRLGRQRGL